MGHWREGPRLPDEYSEGWDVPGVDVNRAFWMMGHESGYRACQYENGIDTETKDGKNSLDHLRQENTALRGLLEANVRVIKEELARELGYGDQRAKRSEAGDVGTPEAEAPRSEGTASPGEQQQLGI